MIHQKRFTSFKLKQLKRKRGTAKTQYIEIKNYNGRYKSNYSNNNIKCKWINQSDKKAEIIK